ncbi:MAG: ATP-binding cassette domain-containing protein [Desulfobacterales bacterium]|nr:ATP-binding cassette domain-containing protein [Desulfobacterales bacterium]MDD4392127.1 ATP-binding cassette domain-containing protein [Desulfobacterales bacterium]
MKPVLRVSHISYIYPGSFLEAISNVSFSAGSGQCVCISGPSGCGKTTLLMAIQGLLKDFSTCGHVFIHPALPGLDAGMVFQNAETQILCSTVGDEVAFWPENLGMSRGAVGAAVADALSSVGLSGLEARSVEALSAGQKHRLTLASVLSMKPGLILLDEPCGQLDDPGKQKLIQILTRLKEQGHTLLISDHDLEPYRLLADRYMLMKNGSIHQTLSQFPSGYEMAAVFDGIEAAGRVGNTSGPPVVEISDLVLTGPENDLLFNHLNLSVRQGEFVHVYGTNGAGKSTLLRCISGFVRTQSGTLQVAGMDCPRPHQLPGKVGLLMQNPHRQLFEDTVFDEVAFTLKRSGRLPFLQIRDQVIRTLEFCDVGHLADRSPLTLSFGEQHRVALASVIVSEPQVLLLDEPFSGLDIARRIRMVNLINRLCRDRDIAVVMASHNRLYDKCRVDQRLVLNAGQLSIQSVSQ